MEQTHQTVYHLYRGEVMLGTITLDQTQVDFPWAAGSFEPSDDFETVKPLFEKELSLIDSLDSDTVGEWESVWCQIIEPGLRLESVETGETISELLIHIDDGIAWWRN